MPQNTQVMCTNIIIDDQHVEMAQAGENACIMLTGVDVDAISPGAGLSYVDHPTSRTIMFEAQIYVLDLMQSKPLLIPGYEAICTFMP
jgi:translation elongation factor EF-1alpha